MLCILLSTRHCNWGLRFVVGLGCFILWIQNEKKQKPEKVFAARCLQRGRGNRVGLGDGRGSRVGWMDVTDLWRVVWCVTVCGLKRGSCGVWLAS